MSKDVAVNQSTEIVIASMYEDDAGFGFEEATKDAYAIPFISVLQAGSPQVKKSEGAYIKGAEEGDIFNSVSQDVTKGDEGVLVVPCYYSRRFVQWGNRSNGGGFKGEFTADDPIVSKTKAIAGRDLLPNDAGEFDPSSSDALVDTRNHYVLVLDKNGGYSPALIAMSSTQLKKSRQFMSKMEALKFKRADGSLFTPPMFSHIYKLTTVPESNDKGSWFGYKIELVGKLEDPALYGAAKGFRNAITAGEVKVQQPMAEAGVMETEDF
jgi:hypothetical protein